MIGPLLNGLLVTLRHFFRPPITLKYPKERREPYPRFRGGPQLIRAESGDLKCVACFLCATVCPAQVIHIEGAEGDNNRKFPAVFEIDLGRCIFCGYCEQACPVEAIRLTRSYELADYKKENLIYTIEKLTK